MYKGLSNKDSNIEELLARILWVNKSKSRIPYKSRYLFISILIVLILYPIIHIKGVEYIQVIIITFIVLMSTHIYFEFHSEKFAQYYIQTNIKKVVKKLNLRLPKRLKVSNDTINLDDIHNFIS